MTPVWLPVIVSSHDGEVAAPALVDSGACCNLVSTTVVQRLGCALHALDEPLHLHLGDGRAGMRLHQRTTDLHLAVGMHQETISFVVAEQLTAPVILGAPWLKAHEPILRFGDGDSGVLFRGECCRGHTTEWPLFVKGTTRTQADAFALITPADRPSAPTVTIPEEYNDLLHAFSEHAPSGPRTFSELAQRHRLHIKLTGDLGAVKQTPMYRMTWEEKAELEKQIDKMMRDGLIVPSSSPYASSPFFVAKPGGAQRMVVDYRKLNAMTMRNTYPIPLIDTLVERLRGATVFTKLDIEAAYNHLPVAPKDRWKTAFRCPLGVFECVGMPFGLVNAPSAWMAFIDDALRPLRAFLVCYFDDLVIFSETRKDHIEHVRSTLARLAELGLRVKTSKCVFHADQVEFCGFVVSGQGVQTSPAKVEAVRAWPTPTTTRAVRSFVGFASFYRQFVPQIADIAIPLTKLTKKGATFAWTRECNDAFEQIKARLISAPILRHADPRAPFTLRTDASDYAVGAVISQRDDLTGEDHPVGFYSRQLRGAELNYTTADKEALAVVATLQHFRHWLLACPRCDVYTDHMNLLAMWDTIPLSQRQRRWKELTAEYPLRLHFVKGENNVAADALSRQGEPPAKELGESPAALLAAITVERPEDKRAIISAYHDAPTAGHPGVDRTTERIEATYTWDGLRDDVAQYIRSCTTCQAHKVERRRPAGLLQPLPVPPGRWTDVTMDLLTDLPRSRGYDAVVVFCDRLTKMRRFAPTTKRCTAEELARLFLEHVVKLHGVPWRVVSDRGTQFTSKFWTALCTRMGIQQCLSSAHHPQTDGQSERCLQDLQAYLRIYACTAQEEWADLLPLAELTANAHVNASTGASPFVANFGEQPRLCALDPLPTSAPAADALAERMAEVTTRLQQQLETAQQGQRRAANARRRHRSLAVGEYAWLSTKHLPPLGECKKLDPRFLGPFKVLACINEVTYKLDLPASMRIHPVFHVSLLRPYVSRDGTVPDARAPTLGPFFNIDRIVNVRTPTASPNNQWEWHVRWLGFDDTENTWEPVSSFASCPETLVEYHEGHPEKPCPDLSALFRDGEPSQ